MGFPREEYCSDEEGPDSDVHLLHVLSLETNGINNKRNASENNEWWGVVQAGSSDLHCQLDMGAYAGVINTT